MATRNQGTSEPPSSHARNLQLPPKRYTHAVGADGRQASEPINTPSRNAPARTLHACAHDSSTCTRFFTTDKWWSDRSAFILRAFLPWTSTRHFPPPFILRSTRSSIFAIFDVSNLFFLKENVFNYVSILCFLELLQRRSYPISIEILKWSRLRIFIV